MPWAEWVRGREIEPSLYGADLAHLGDAVEGLLDAGCRIFHFDVGDGHFVEPITMGPIVLQWIAPIVHAGGARLDVHLMVESPERYFRPVVRAGGDSVTFHVEAVDSVPAAVAAARGAGLGVGVAFNPETEPEEVAAVAGGADLILCMGIHPGYSGQPFRKETFDRVRRLHAALSDASFIQVDGGVSERNVEELADCGATLFVAASSVFGGADAPAAYRRLASLIG